MAFDSELKEKLKRLRSLLKARSLEGVLLSSRANFAWLTGGRTNQIRSDVEKGVASLWVTQKGLELWCNAIEEKRFREEEALGMPLDYQIRPWYEPFKPSFKKAASDDGSYGLHSLKEEIAQLRWSLHSEEAVRYMQVGRLSGEALEVVGKKVRKGWKETQVAAELSSELITRGLEPTVILVGSDERLVRHRHPLPTNRVIENTV